MSERVVLVTGASRGIGREVARQLSARGDHVVATARRPESADVVQLDVTDAASVAAAAATVDERFGRLDVLVNNAAVDYDTWERPSAADLAVVEEAMATNVVGAWRVTVAFVPLLRRSDHGRIVNVSSEAGSLASIGAGTPAYSVSKAALNALTLSLAADLGRDGVLVNAVCPGWVATDMGGPGGRPVEEGAASVIWAVDLPDNGPTGGFYRDGRPVPW